MPPRAAIALSTKVFLRDAASAQNVATVSIPDRLIPDRPVNSKAHYSAQLK